MALAPIALLAGSFVAAAPVQREFNVANDPRVLDTFEDASPWRALSSDQVSASLRAIDGLDGNALCLVYDFNGVSGHAAMRRSLPLQIPENYELAFQLRGNAPINDLQFKLIDASGENVWWVNRPKMPIPPDWQPVSYRKRHVEFAWGPTTDRTLRKSAEIEFTVYAHEGGRGQVCFDTLVLRELPVSPTVPADPVARASSGTKEHPPSAVIDGDPTTDWRAQGEDSPWLELDFGASREFGGVALEWLTGEHPAAYDLQGSDDGSTWRTLRQVRQGNGGSDALHLPESEARYVRIVMHGDPSSPVALRSVELLPPLSANAFFERLAKAAPRGRYPRGFSGEQTYWTVVGIDGGLQTALMSEDGAIEVARGGFSIEPFLVIDGQTVTWADADITHSLRDRYLPMPQVHWRTHGLSLDVSAFAEGTRKRSQVIARYVLGNEGDAARTLTLALAIRPFQVNPPIQFLNTAGGVSPIGSLAFERDQVVVDGHERIHMLTPADFFVATAYDAGMIHDRLKVTDRRSAHAIVDPTGYASGALLYEIELPPRSRRTVALAFPLAGEPMPLPVQGELVEELDRRESRVARDWHRKLDRVGLSVPATAQAVADTMRTALAHALINRHGVEIRPGTRSYGRSWIRDGAMTSEALLRLGHTEAAADFLRWYAPYQFASGKVPCCVDYRGSDPVPENDSHGELIHLVGEVWRYGRDRSLLESMWPHVDAAARYMDQLRRSERTEANLTPQRRSQYGLMPPSISHEGYSAKPAYSYWDDFWALTGYKQAVRIAQALGQESDAERLRASRDEFQSDLLASIAASAVLHDIDFIPGAAELGDLDATSTTIALAPAGAQEQLPADLLRSTFERYWQEFTARRDDRKPWDAYTPYELRNVSALMRLGEIERAHEALAWFMDDRRPAAWNQWAEVVSRNEREPRFIGDMPHGWVASDYIRSVLDLFAYERDDDASLLLAAGVPDDWLVGDGIAVRELRTPYGLLSYTLRRDAEGLHLTVADTGIELPSGGLTIADRGLTGAARLNGASVPRTDRGEVQLSVLPAELHIAVD